MFTVKDLNRKELIELKRTLILDANPQASREELDNADNLISDEEVYTAFADLF